MSAQPPTFRLTAAAREVAREACACGDKNTDYIPAGDDWESCPEYWGGNTADWCDSCAEVLDLVAVPAGRALCLADEEVKP